MLWLMYVLQALVTGLAISLITVGLWVLGDVVREGREERKRKEREGEWRRNWK